MRAAMAAGTGERRRRRRLAGIVLALTAWGGAVAATAQAEDPFLRRTATVRAVESAGPAVVNVTTEQIARAQSPFGPSVQNPYFERYFSELFEPRSPRTLQNLGSGVIISGEGHVLTNEHVVARATHISVTLADGRGFDARIVGADPTNDLAVLQIETDEALPWILPVEPCQAQIRSAVPGFVSAGAPDLAVS